MNTKDDNSVFGDLAPIQYQDIYHEDDVPLCDVRTSAFRYLIYGGLLIVLLFLILGSTTSMSRTIKTDFTLENLKRDYVVRFFDDVYLQRSFVKPGQEVLSGEPLIQISSGSISQFISSYRQAREALARFRQFQKPLSDTQVESLRLQQAQKNKEIEQLLAINKQNETIFLAEQKKSRLIIAGLWEKARRGRELFSKDLIAAEAFSEVQKSYEEALQDSILLARKYRKQAMESDKIIELLKSDIELLIQKIQENQKQHGVREVELEQEDSRLRQEIEQRYGHVRLEGGSLVLLAEEPGTVSFLLDQHEGTVSRETTILRLQPDMSELRVVSVVGARDIARVHLGSFFKLQFDAFPRSQLGYREGTITSINTTPDKRGKYPFTGRISPDDQSRIIPRSSLTGTCYIRVEEGVFFKYVFQGVQELIYDTFQ